MWCGVVYSPEVWLAVVMKPCVVPGKAYQAPGRPDGGDGVGGEGGGGVIQARMVLSINLGVRIVTFKDKAC